MLHNQGDNFINTDQDSLKANHLSNLSLRADLLSTTDISLYLKWPWHKLSTESSTSYYSFSETDLIFFFPPQSISFLRGDECYHYTTVKICFQGVISFDCFAKHTHVVSKYLPSSLFLAHKSDSNPLKSIQCVLRACHSTKTALIKVLNEMHCLCEKHSSDSCNFPLTSVRLYTHWTMPWYLRAKALVVQVLHVWKDACGPWCRLAGFCCTTWLIYALINKSHN